MSLTSQHLGGTMARKKKRTWGPHDEVLIYVCSVLATIRAQRWEELADITTTFPRQVEGERILLDRPYSFLVWGSPDDGTYVHDGSTVLAVGRGAAPLMIGAAVGRAIGNSSRRAAAAAAAQPRWMTTEAGHLYVSTHGFYLGAPSGLHRWSWEHIDGASVPAPGFFDMQGQGANGPVNWRLGTHAAELLFVLWALVRHPQHPQMATESWLPTGWVGWAAHEHGKTVPGVTVPQRPLSP